MVGIAIDRVRTVYRLMHINDQKSSVNQLKFVKVGCFKNEVVLIFMFFSEANFLLLRRSSYLFNSTVVCLDYG